VFEKTFGNQVFRGMDAPVDSGAILTDSATWLRLFIGIRRQFNILTRIR
jgi:hypothetical protein